MTAPKDPRKMRLLGDAAKLLARADVDSMVIGEFIADFGACVEEVLAEQPIVQLDLTAQLAAAVKSVLEESDLIKRGPSANGRKTVQVLIGSHRTSVSLRPELLNEAVTLMGGMEPVREQIDAWANSMPETKNNRSGWVEEQLQQFLLVAKARSELEGSTQH